MNYFLKTIKSIFIFVFITLFGNNFALATISETDSLLMKSEIIEAAFEARISVDEYVPVGKALLLDSSGSKLLPLEKYGKPKYYWDLHNGEGLKEGKELVYTFKTVGKKNITLKIEQGGQSTISEKEIFGYQKKILLITDKKEKLFNELIIQAAENGTWLKIFVIESKDIGFLTEEKLFQKFQSSKDSLEESSVIIFYIESIDGFSSFTRYFQSLSSEKKFNLTDKMFIQIADGNLGIKKAIIDMSRKTLNITNVLLTRPEAFNPLFESQNIKELKNKLDLRAIENIIIDKTTDRSKFFFLSKLISYFISAGIPSNTLYLLLAFPFVAFFVTFARQFIGISTFGVYLPIMLSLTFFILGINFAFIILAIVGILSMLIRYVLSKIDMLYIPRVALTLSTITLSFFVVIWFALKIESSVIIPVSIFPMLVISTISEKFTAIQAQEGMKNAVIGMLETIIIAFLAYIFSSGDFLRNLIISIPEMIFFPLIGIIILGKFTGLRITEYFKFRAILREGLEE